MGIFQAPVPIIAQVGNAPQILFMSTSDNLATITAAGYMNSNVLPGAVQVNPNDMLLISYSAANAYPHLGTLSWFTVAVSAGIITLTELQSSSGVNATLPTILGHIATYSNTTGDITEDPATAISGGNIQAGLSGTAGYLASFPSTASKGSLRLTAVANTGNTLTTISNAAMGQASVVSIPDPGTATANFILSEGSGQVINSGSFYVNNGQIFSGSNGSAGLFSVYSATPLKGYLSIAATANTGNTVTTISNAAMGQASVISIPDPGTATSKFVLQDGTNTSGTFTTLNAVNLKYGATPVAQVDPASCTITAAAGAANTATITIQLKDGSGTNMARIIPFRVYSSSAADGLTLQSAASTGYSVASGGLSLANGTAVTTQISCMSSATGGCVLSLLDTAKLTSYLVLVLDNGTKISAQLTAGSYG